MATIHASSHNASRMTRCADSTTNPTGGRRLRNLLSLVNGTLGALFAAELVLPEADPDQIRALLIELSRLNAAAPPAERIEALKTFRTEKALPPDGRADGRTVTELMREVRLLRELRELGLSVD